MTISLNSVTLDNDLFWEEEFSYPASAQNILRTVLGNSIIQTMPLVDGQDIILIARRSGNTYTGHFTRTQIEGFKILEASATPVEFVYDTEVHEVIVKSGGVQMEPLIPYTEKNATDKYTGTLTLVKV
jgi:hypothetical protein